MGLYEGYIIGIEHLLSLNTFIGLLLGAIIGWVFGVIPGLQSVTALVVVLPFTFYMEPMMAMYIFAGIIGTAGGAGAITSIVLNMPGTAQNAATALDGYPLSKQGKTIYAIAIATFSSLIGAYFGLIILVLFIPIFVPFLMLFGPAEVFWIMTFGLVTLAIALPGSLVRNLVAIGIGAVLGMVGYGGPSVAVPRLTFGTSYLTEGLNLALVVIGLLVVSEALGNLIKTNDKGDTGLLKKEVKGAFWEQTLDAFKSTLKHPALLLRGSVIGSVIGAVPGVGGVVAQFLAYNSAYATSKEKEKFGRGSIEGLIAANAATDAKEGGTLLPTITFGIPGNGEMALVLAAWQMHGLQPGPFFLQNHSDLAWALIIGLAVANLISFLLNFASLPLVSYIPSFRQDYVSMGVIVISMLAALAIRQNLWDVGLILVLGLLGYWMRLSGLPVIGPVIGFVLGGPMESNFYTALQSGLGSYTIFVSSVVSVSLAVCTLLAIVWFSLGKLRKQEKVVAPSWQK